jgi:FMN-dependent NADH-azoreductase
MKLLHIDSSALGGASVSRQLTAQVVAQWKATTPAPRWTTWTWWPTPPHLSRRLARLPHAARRGTERGAARENAVSEALVSQFLAADVVVVGAPLYNFSVPSQLKAWIDRVAQVGRTFKYTEKGPQGLAGGKTVIVVSSRGGVYSTSEAAVPWNTRRATCRPCSASWASPTCALCAPKAWPWGKRPRLRRWCMAERGVHPGVRHQQGPV